MLKKIYVVYGISEGPLWVLEMFWENERTEHLLGRYDPYLPSFAAYTHIYPLCIPTAITKLNEFP